MKRKLLLCFTILPLLAAGLAGCSSDEEKTEDLFSDPVFDTATGKVVIREIEDYPDSVGFSQYLKYVKCNPIKRSEMPRWLYEELVKYSRSSAGLAMQGEWKKNGEVAYVIQTFLLERFSNVYDSTGNSLKISANDEESFIASTTNWRCIYILSAYPIKKLEL